MVYHVLKDGTITNDITGKVVKMQDAEALYTLMSNIGGNRRLNGRVKSKGSRNCKYESRTGS